MSFQRDTRSLQGMSHEQLREPRAAVESLSVRRTAVDTRVSPRNLLGPIFAGFASLRGSPRELWLTYGLYLCGGYTYHAVVSCMAYILHLL